MKISLSRTLLLLSGTLFLQSSYALPTPRATVWGYGGTDVLARGDVMAGLLGNDQRLLWGDVQGKYGEEGTYTGSAGLGYRQVYNHCSRILGIYGFMDYTVSDNNKAFWIASPGVESLGNIWDFRVNGYFPVSRRTRNLSTAFGDELGITNSVTFVGHEQFDHLFNLVEEVGSGVDGEIGRTFPCLHHAKLFVGGYYFKPHQNNTDTSFSSVQGGSARLEYPLHPHVVLQAIDTYDNFAHNTALIGLQLSIGGSSNRVFPCDIRDRMLDPVSRNLSTQSRGNSVPIFKGVKDSGVSVLELSDIFFFTSTGGAAFDPSLGIGNGTFENPLSGGSFNQATIDALNAIDPVNNFYFNPGTYTIPVLLTGPMPTPAARTVRAIIPPSTGTSLTGGNRISLHPNQSLWGRTADYTQPAQGDNRPLFLGGIDIGTFTPAGNNRLDSIQVLNALTDTNGGDDVEIRVLEIESSLNVVLNNTSITGSATRVGDLGLTFNYVSGIYGNFSEVVINSSTVSASSIVTLENAGLNFAAGIGGNSGSGAVNTTTGNNYTIIDSAISGTALTGTVNDVENFATAIGGNGANLSTAAFLHNTYTVKNSALTATADTGGDNLFANFAVAIGGNTNAGNASTTSDTYILLNNNIVANAIVHGSNLGGGSEPGSGQNFAAGIGGNAIFEDSSEFVTNTVVLSNCHIQATASLGGSNGTSTDSEGSNYSTGIGGNASPNVGVAVADFISNPFTITNSSINSTASIAGDNFGSNFGTGIGSNFKEGSSAAFTGNTFNINGFTMNVIASVLGTNTGPEPLGNLAIGVDCTDGGNTINIDDAVINVLAHASSGSNLAFGLIATGTIPSADVINISNSTLTVIAAPTGTATASVGNVNFFHTTHTP